MSKENNINKAPNPEEFYKKLQTQLEEHHNFPEDYTFKFIIENNPSLLTDIYKVLTKPKIRFQQGKQ